MSPRIVAPVLLFVLSALATTVALTARSTCALAAESHQTSPLDKFIGHYEGRSLFPMGEARNREFAVTIEPHDTNGFIIEWNTIHTGQPDSQGKTHTLAFLPTPDIGVYVADSMVDNSRPPLINAPIAWATLVDATLTVHVLTIVENGDYVVQSYVRTLTPTGLTLDFTRVRSGIVERTIKGTLRRVDSPLPALPESDVP